MKITLILCTYNRSQSISTALASFAAMTVPDEVEWEVLVVDNNSTDQTREVVQEFCVRYPGLFRYLFEPQAGKSNALNAGIRESLGDVLAFSDDDVTVEPTWLQNLTEQLGQGPWAGAGGRTLLAHAFSPPRWLALEGPFSMGFILAAQFDLGDKPCDLETPPFGANMAFQKKIFEKYGGFRTDLGPSPTRQIPRPNEDTEFGRRLFAGGERLRYEPSAVVYHPVPEGRLNRDYFLSWWFDCGRANIREMARRPDIWGVPRRYLTIIKIVSTILVPRSLRWMFALNSQRRFYCKCMLWSTAGQVIEIYRQWRDAEQSGDREMKETS